MNSATNNNSGANKMNAASKKVALVLELLTLNKVLDAASHEQLDMGKANVARLFEIAAILRNFKPYAGRGVENLARLRANEIVVGLRAAKRALAA